MEAVELPCGLGFGYNPIGTVALKATRDSLDYLQILQLQQQVTCSRVYGCLHGQVRTSLDYEELRPNVRSSETSTASVE